MKRHSGIFLHPTSLPSRYGVGDFGGGAFGWIDLLHARKQSAWQVCPLGPTGYGDSPYQTLSSFAGNTLLISPSRLIEEGLLDSSDAKEYPFLSSFKVDFGAVISAKEALLDKACEAFIDSEAFLNFCDEEKFWLEDYSLFRVLKELHKGVSWFEWKAPYKLRFPAALEDVKGSHRKTIRNHKVKQFFFYSQWAKLKAYANEKGIKVIGDVPYYVASDSADAWSMPDLFELDEEGRQVRVGGVPPDYFSVTGQRWGNPIYRWDTMRENRYHWWVGRVRKALSLFDTIRFDHFRGFESFWAIPAQCSTAIEGIWEPGPGIDFFGVLKEDLGALPVIAEDLGDITPQVLELRKATGFPGIKVLQFAFDGNADNPYLPYSVSPNSVMYTGTHDNNTSLGWFLNLSPVEKDRVCEYIGCGSYDFLTSFLRTAYSSPANLCIVPFQDILGLGSEHRLNTPGVERANWQWRFTMDMVTEDKLRLLEDFTRIYGRLPG